MKHTLIDLSGLAIVPKTVRSIEEQQTFESRKLWEDVTCEFHCPLFY